MHTITTRVTDGVYESIVREAARRDVSIDQIVDEWLVEQEEHCSPASGPEELEAFDSEQEHHLADRRALREWHESLAKHNP